MHITNPIRRDLVRGLSLGVVIWVVAVALLFYATESWGISTPTRTPTRTATPTPTPTPKPCRVLRCYGPPIPNPPVCIWMRCG